MLNTDDAARLVGDSLNALVRIANDPQIDQVTVEGSEVRFRDTDSGTWFVLTVEAEGGDS
jgi:hypothetical protein